MSAPTHRIQPGDVLELCQRLATILELHRVAEREQEGAGPVRWCVECRQTYPCPTVQAIRVRS